RGRNRPDRHVRRSRGRPRPHPVSRLRHRPGRTRAGRGARRRRPGLVARRGAPAAPASSLAEAVAGAELIVVAVPVGAAPAVVQEVLDSASPDVVVTDVASTKRSLASLDDPRFVPGHPVAGGATGGPARAAADLFDEATWFLTPAETTSPESVERVEQFVA